MVYEPVIYEYLSDDVRKKLPYFSRQSTGAGGGKIDEEILPQKPSDVLKFNNLSGRYRPEVFKGIVEKVHDESEKQYGFVDESKFSNVQIKSEEQYNQNRKRVLQISITKTKTLKNKGKTMVEQNTKNLNIRLSESEKSDLENRAENVDMKLSEYIRYILFSNESRSETNAEQSEAEEKQGDSLVIQMLRDELNKKNETIRSLIESNQQQNVLLLKFQKENQELKLIEHDKKSWWQFWK
ncbi:plasmid mobilization protein [Streptococcus caprae]